MSTEYLTTGEAAARLKLSKRYLEALRSKGGGPRFIALGRAVRYSAGDVDTWAESRKIESTSCREAA